jgi:hypothetical protein
MGTHLVTHPLDDILWTFQGGYEVLGSFLTALSFPEKRRGLRGDICELLYERLDETLRRGHLCLGTI